MRERERMKKREKVNKKKESDKEPYVLEILGLAGYCRDWDRQEKR